MSRVLGGKDLARLINLAGRLKEGERFTWLVFHKDNDERLCAVPKQKRPIEYVFILSIEHGAGSREELLKKTALALAYLNAKCDVELKAIQDGFLLKGDRSEHFTDFLQFFAKYRK